MKKSTIVIKLIPLYCTVFVLLLLIAGKGSSAVSTYYENQRIKNITTIVIDPGHGGIDGGATSYSGILESQINLEISLRLDDLLHLLGINTVMIRKTDESIYTTGATISQKKISDLRERVRIVSSVENAVLISIHQNYFSDSRYCGPQIFYKNGQGSKTFAKELQNNLNKYLAPNSNRNIKLASGIYLLDKINCDSVLIECGFISNPSDDAKLNDEGYQKNLCVVIATTCSGFIKTRSIS